MREDFGSDYFMQGEQLIFMLGGDNKASQASDIEQAKIIAMELKNEQNQNPRI